MTTEVVLRYFADVFHDREWPLFSSKSRNTSFDDTPAIGVAELSARLSSDLPNLNLATARLGTIAAKMLVRLECDGYQIWAYVSHGAWRPVSPAIMRQRLWNSCSLLVSPGVIKNSNDIAIESDNSVRFAGAVCVTGDAFVEALQIVRTDPACFLFCSRRDNISSDVCLREIFTIAFPARSHRAQERVDWRSLVVGLCTKGDLVIRATGVFDDQEAGIDIFGQAHRVVELLNEAEGNNAGYLS